jgi:hypothetical protein
MGCPEGHSIAQAPRQPFELCHRKTEKRLAAGGVNEGNETTERALQVIRNRTMHRDYGSRWHGRGDLPRETVSNDSWVIDNLTRYRIRSRQGGGGCVGSVCDWDRNIDKLRGFLQRLKVR